MKNGIAFAIKSVFVRIRGIYRKIIMPYRISSGKIYDKKFYDSCGRQEVKHRISRIIVASLVEKFKPTSIVDIGCGDGVYLQEFSRFAKATGFDNSDEALKRCRKKGLNARKLNLLNRNLPTLGKYDLVVCFEVAEHIPNYASDRLVSLLASCGDTIVFTAAPPGQGGYYHINEQPYDFWVAKFQQIGFMPAYADMDYLKKSWSERDVAIHMIKNLFVFKRN